MLLQPAIVAAILARSWHWSILAALSGVLAVYAARQPLLVLARQRFVWKDRHPETADARKALFLVAFVSALAGAALLTRWPVELLVIMGSGAAAMTVVAVWAAVRNKARSVLVQIAGAAGLTASSVAIAASACGSIPHWTLWLWGAMALQASAAILVVHARLDARIRGAKNQKIETPTAAYVAQAALMLAALALAVRQEWMLAAAMALPAALNWFELTMRVARGEGLKTPLTTIGLRAMALSIAVNVLMAAGLWNRSGCAA